MAAARLNDSQKAELVERFRGGEGLQPLADAYGCSPNTVSRAVRAALAPEEYERLKDQRTRRGGAASASAPAPDPTPDPVPEPVVEAGASPLHAPEEPDPAPAEPDPAAAPMLSTAPEPLEPRSSSANPLALKEPALLAIDDADDFAEDDDEDDDEADAADGSDGQASGGLDDGEAGESFVIVSPAALVDDHSEIRPLPFTAAEFSGGAWMLVDKTVELQPRPVSDFSELGRLPEDERDRQALAVYVNPRQAKRQCGRTQRVISIPDPAVFSRTAPYLLAQGISRVVIEGSLFALPGS